MKAAELYTNEQPVMSLVEGVCVRPGMYTLNGTLEEAAVFLNGFHSGMASHNRSEGAAKEVERWSRFCRWACQQLGSGHSGWYDVFQALRNRHSDDDEAFGHLAALCIQYRQEQGAS